MDIVFELLLLFFFVFINKKHSKVYWLFICIQAASFFLQFFIAKTSHYDTYKTILNSIFISINLYLIISPWRFANITTFTIGNRGYFLFFRRWLYVFLKINIVVNIIILFVVLLFIPSIASFKQERAFYQLYDSIPYFSIIFRYASFTQNLGYFAIPFYFYYLSIGNKKAARKALILSLSSLISGFAFFSRAQILTFILVFVSYSLFALDTIPNKIKVKIKKNIKIAFSFIILLFLLITFLRFGDSKMMYLLEKIPQESFIQDPIWYSIADYAAQGHPNGLNLLEDYSADKSLKGEEIFYNINLLLGFFHITSWNYDDYADRAFNAYDNDMINFMGYTCPMVYNFGYVLTFFVSLLFFLYVKRLFYNKKNINIEKMFLVIQLLVIPSVAIFYCGFAIIIFSIIFLLIIKTLYYVSSTRRI